VTAGAAAGGHAAEVVAGRGARVFPIPPPLYYGAAFGAAMLLDTVLPGRVGARAVTVPLGAAVLAAGVALMLAALGTVLAHRTTVVPHGQVSTLVTSGVYRISRNPMYTGLAITYAGGALLAGSWWPLVLLPGVLLVVLRVVIVPEERYLAGRFGAPYARYRDRVRRWL
jgi:protein-S-isoprenylcysteine O-methyltransferase Ste14